MALLRAPDFSDGIITAARLQQLSDAHNQLIHQSARVTVDFPLTVSSTTLQDVTELAIELEAGASYDIDAVMIWALSSGTAADIKFGSTFPVGCSVDFGGVGPHTAMGAAVVFGDAEFVARLSATSGSTAASYGGSTGSANARMFWTIDVGGTGGTLQIQAAQATSDPATTTVKKGSKIRAIRTR